MSTLIVYFSLEGNTAYIADELARRLGADTLRLVRRITRVVSRSTSGAARARS